MTRPVYLDCAASTPPAPPVVECMRTHLTGEFGNPGSRTHVYGEAARRAVEQARDEVARVVNARRTSVIFTSGATEANNLAILGSRARHIVTTQIEHPSVLEPVLEAEARGARVTRVAPGADGSVAAEDILAAVSGETDLVSVMHVNNETGAIQPIAAIAEGLRDRPGIRLHVDAAQGFGKLLDDLRHPRIDCLSVSAHKIGGPQGIGALIIQRTKEADGPPKLQPLLFGGGQEFGLRPGTLPAHLIAGFGLASALAVRENQQRLQMAHDWKRLAIQAFAGAKIHGDPVQSSPFILNLAFPGMTSEEVMDAWAGLAAVSNGAACSSHRVRCSYVLQSMAVPDQQAAGAVRLSWYGGGTAPDFEKMAEALRG